MCSQDLIGYFFCKDVINVFFLHVFFSTLVTIIMYQCQENTGKTVNCFVLHLNFCESKL